MEDDLLTADFSKLIQAVNTRNYHREGMEAFLRDFGPSDYRSVAAYEKVTGSPLPGTVIGGAGRQNAPAPEQGALESDPAAEANFFAPQRAALAAYNAGLEKYHLDGYVYPRATDAAERRDHPSTGRQTEQRTPQQHRLGQ